MQQFIKIVFVLYQIMNNWACISPAKVMLRNQKQMGGSLGSLTSHPGLISKFQVPKGTVPEELYAESTGA